MSHNHKVLHIVRSRAWGGLELYVVQLIKRMSEAGKDVSIYCIKESKIHKEMQGCGIKIFHARGSGRFNPLEILRIRKIIKEHKFNILHTHTHKDVWLGSLVAWLFKCFKLAHVFSLYMDAGNKKKTIQSFIYSRLDAIITPSETLKKEVHKKFPVPESKIYLVKYGRDSAQQKPKDPELAKRIRALHDTKDSDIVIASVCRIDPAKGIQEFAESLLYLPPAVLEKVKYWFIGEPTLLYTNSKDQPVYEDQSLKMHQWLVQFANKEEYKNKIRLIPFQKDLFPYFSAIDIFALSTYKETYSLSVLDAMNMGIPVIGTNTGGTVEQIKDHERGLLVLPKNPKSIANAITFYITHPDKIAEHGINAKAWSLSTHSWEKAIIAINNIYYSCIKA